MDGGNSVSMFRTIQQEENTVELLKSRNFLLSFQVKKLSEQVKLLELELNELKKDENNSEVE
jgi:hypothetical protein